MFVKFMLERIKAVIKAQGETTKHYFAVNEFHNIFLCMAWQKMIPLI